MTEEKLSDLERECWSHLLSYLRGLTNAREFWYLVALEQEHYASREAVQMMQHVKKQPLIICCVPGCNRDGDAFIAGGWFCREHKDQVKVQP